MDSKLKIFLSHRAVLIASNQIVLFDLFTASTYMKLRRFDYPITSIDFSDRRLAAIAGGTLHVIDFYSDSGTTSYLLLRPVSSYYVLTFIHPISLLVLIFGCLESTIPCDIPASAVRFYEREKLVVGDVGGRLFAWDFQRNTKVILAFSPSPHSKPRLMYLIS